MLKRNDPVYKLTSSCQTFVKHHNQETSSRSRPRKRARKKEYWASGTGYGGGSKSQRMAKTTKKWLEKKQSKSLALLSRVVAAFETFCQLPNNLCVSQYIHVVRLFCIAFVKKTKTQSVKYESFLVCLVQLLRTDSMIEISTHIDFYKKLMLLVQLILKCVGIRFLLFIPFPESFSKSDPTIFSLVENLVTGLDSNFLSKMEGDETVFLNLSKEILRVMNFVKTKLNFDYFLDKLSQNSEPEVGEEGVILLGSKSSLELDELLQIKPRALSRSHRKRILELSRKLDDTENDKNKLINAYSLVIRSLCFKACEIKNLAINNVLDYAFLHQSMTREFHNKKRVLRIARELTSLFKSIPISFSSSIIVRVDETQNDVLSFLIFGPEGTPYENGAFCFDCFLDSYYPDKPPRVLLKTTGYGTVRFNPNLYANGKVCLSLLGTWTGPSWSPETSTLLQVLVSIQSLIFVDEPFFNEPGYESNIGTQKGKALSNNYNKKIVLDTLRFAILAHLNKPHFLFKDVLEAHFQLKSKQIIERLENWQETYYPNNAMFMNYMELSIRKLQALCPQQFSRANSDIIQVSSPQLNTFILISDVEQDEIEILTDHTAGDSSDGVEVDLISNKEPEIIVL